MSAPNAQTEHGVTRADLPDLPVEPYRVPVVTWTHKGLTLMALTGATILDVKWRLAHVNCPNEELATEAARASLNLWRSLMAFRNISGTTIHRQPDAEFVMWELDDLEPCEILAEVEEVLERIRLEGVTS